MKLLRPSPPPRPAADRPPSGATLRRSSAFRCSPQKNSPGGPVAVAVGRSPEKTLALLRWTFSRLGGGDVVLLHVHQPSPTIPTLLGKLPASQANEELVSAYRKEERECTKKILLSYMSFCYGAQVGADTIVIENGDIHKGIVELVVKHGFQKLVVGAAPDSCFKVKGKSSTTTFIAKNAPPFCEICFVNKGKHVWTREASEGTGSLLPVSSPIGHAPEERFSSRSVNSYNNETTCSPECSRSGCFTRPEMQNMGETEFSNTEMILSPPASSILECDSQNSSMNFTSTGTSFSLSSPIEKRSSSVFCSKDEMELMPIYSQIKEVTREDEKLKIMVSSEIVRRKRLESETAEALNKAKAAEAAYAHEAKLREELEDQLRTARLKAEELVRQRNEAMRELQDVRKTIATLDGHAHELACQRDEAAGKLDLIQAPIATLRLERQKICLLREEGGSQLEKWRNSSHTRSRNCSKVVPFGNDTFSFTKFSLSDLQTATCDFSESFKLGQSGYGCVYKGEMLNRTVVIKKLYAHNVQCQSEFQQEVYVLSNLRHPHLVTLIGVCPEGLSLVYEYVPNGSLHDRLFCKTSIPPLTWKIRTRIVAEISSALLFLHSSKPEKIIHGDLKPENIFLDVNFGCKIGDFGTCRLVPEDTVDLPLVHRSIEPKGTFSYADLEYQRTGVLTPKTDVYSFGIIMLQLLTGKPPLGLASDVRRAMSAGKLSSVLDPSAGEWPIFVARKLAEFALQCTEMNSRDRPELTPAVVRELEELHVTEQRPIPSYFLCPILQEIMHDPQVAADGFTYEGSALRGWLQNGRGTSPMTNLKLEHLNLTPNHALRFAIQDWLCMS